MGAAPDTSAAPVRTLADLPGPRGWPWVGNLLQLDRTRVHYTVEQWALQYGPLFRIRLGPTPFLVVADHEAIAAMLRDRPDGFRRPPRLDIVWREMGLSTGVFGANGEPWKRQRRMVMAGFDPAHVRAYFPSLSRVTQRLRQRWQLAAASGSAVDLQSDLMRFTVDAIAGLAFGSDIDTLGSDEVVIQQHLDKIFPAVARRMLAPYPYWRHVKMPADHRLDSAVREVNQAVEGFIRQARLRLGESAERRRHPQNLLEVMLLAADAPDSGMDDHDVAGNVLTMLLAGEDTTANTLAWMLHLLQDNPDALRQVQMEVRGVAAQSGASPADHVFTHDEIDRLDFVEACAHETMRLKPVGPLNVLQALRDTRVADVHVPAGSMVWCVMRHDTLQDRLFADARRFDPQRWLAGDQGNRSASSAKRVSMPFGAGPRVCPGRYLALLEIKMAIAMLVNTFDIDAVCVADGSEPREHLSFTMAPVGLTMRLRLRQGVGSQPAAS
ncbi:MAG: cytochrome P450 [Rhodoferax sp.]|nr:cytochrome P450 [Rhodoferax sp.]